MVKPSTAKRFKVKRGIMGIEAAIVLIAFVVVAAALAFVALNMEFYTTQRSKEVMVAGLAQASSALEIDGTVLAKIDTKNGRAVECMVIPIRLSAGQKDVDLTPGKADIGIWIIDKFAATNVYMNESQAVTSVNDYNIETLCTTAQGVTNGVAVIWNPQNNKDTVLQAGEKVLVVIYFEELFADQGAMNVALESYNVVKVEIKPPIGAALTVERTIPASLTYSIIDLG